MKLTAKDKKILFKMGNEWFNYYRMEAKSVHRPKWRCNRLFEMGYLDRDDRNGLFLYRRNDKARELCKIVIDKNEIGLARLIKNTIIHYSCDQCAILIKPGGNIVRVINKSIKSPKSPLWYYLCLKCAEGIKINDEVNEGIGYQCHKTGEARPLKGK